MLAAGDEITTSQTIYVYAETATTPNCFDEKSFMAKIFNVSELPDFTTCESYKLPNLSVGKYYTQPGGNGNQIPAGTILGQWQFNNLCITNPQFDKKGNFIGCGTNAAVRTVIIFQSGGVTFTASTCTVSAGSQNVTVTLPSIAASALGAVGATAGTTQFAINLTGCNPNLSVSATLSTNSPYAGPNGVIAPTAGAGYASGVGIQILQPNGATPVTFDTAFSTGTTNNNTNYTFNLYARYYQTAAPMTPGQVQATATYTLTYQ